jgi:transcriptional regulator with XRE-family HTH domain
MKLADWIQQQGMLRTEFARQLGVSGGHVSDLCNHRNWPTREVFRRIWELTDGAVTPNDFLFDYDVDSGLTLQKSRAYPRPRRIRQ